MSNRIQYNAEYNRQNYTAYTLRLRTVEDADIIAYLESKMENDSFTAVIRQMLQRSLKASRRKKNNETVRYQADVQTADQQPAGSD